MEFYLKSQKEFEDFSENFAKSFTKNHKNKAIIGLKGTLGAGKSLFTRKFINSLQKNAQEIVSPTFNLVLNYDAILDDKKIEISHFDLYRLKSFEELENIDFFEILKENFCLIEWPEIAEKFLKKQNSYLEIEILIKNQNERIVKIS